MREICQAAVAENNFIIWTPDASYGDCFCLAEGMKALRALFAVEIKPLSKTDRQKVKFSVGQAASLSQ